jgi:hypothetical protein
LVGQGSPGGDPSLVRRRGPCPEMRSPRSGVQAAGPLKILASATALPDA